MIPEHKVESSNIFIVLTTQYPGVPLVSFLDNLLSQIAYPLILINDGFQKDQFERAFSLLSKYKQVEFLHHAIPLGEKSALRTGINHILLHHDSDPTGIITFNTNDRFPVKDICKIINALRENPTNLCLGTYLRGDETFSKPWLGNILAKYAFRFSTGYVFSGFQSSLVGIPSHYFRFFDNERIEDVKTVMLMHCVQNRYPVQEIPISYDHETKKRIGSLRDSIILSFVFLRFSMLSFSTAIIDNFVFFIAFKITRTIFISLIIARLIAGSYNYLLGSRWVFKSVYRPAKQALKYAFLVITLMFISYGLLTPMITYLGFNPYISKILAEGTIFLLSFTAQAIFVYSPKRVVSGQTERTIFYIKLPSISKLFRQLIDRFSVTKHEKL